MKVLFIGGTGVISSACSELAVEKGFDLTVINRGKTSRELPDHVRRMTADIRDVESVKNAIREELFDVIVDWVAFQPEHVQQDIELFRDRTGQYIFISTASAYQTPPVKLPVTEETPLENPFWAYSRDKIACEQVLITSFEQSGFPVTIVRPSHTYDRTMLPCRGKYTTIARMRQGKKVFIHGDGESIWTLTHHRDFATGFVGLLGNSAAIGEAFHITSDEWLTWNRIYQILADAAGGELHPVYVPSDFINVFDAEMGAGLLGDKARSMIFDNSKIKKFVPEFKATIPFEQGAREIMAWFDADASRRKIDPHMDALTEKMIAAWQKAWPR